MPHDVAERSRGGSAVRSAAVEAGSEVVRAQRIGARPGTIRAAYRALAFLYRQSIRAERVLGELVTVLHSPELERYAIDRHYRTDPRFFINQDEGLFPYEARALAAYFPHVPARLLVAGAGGGREVVALAKRGHSVDAFEPVPELVEACRRATKRNPRVRIEQATLQSWSARASERYDGIVVGWGAWGHLLAQADRLAALAAFRRACPAGPVLIGFLRGEAIFDPAERPVSVESLHADADEPWQAWTRRWIRRALLDAPPLERGTSNRAGIYYHETTEAEVYDEAAQTGYRVVFFERDWQRYPNAVLVPITSA